MDKKILQQHLKEIEKMCDERLRIGEKEYGVFDPDTPLRDWYQEAIEELYDTINYARFEIIRLKRLQLHSQLLTKNKQDGNT